MKNIILVLFISMLHTYSFGQTKRSEILPLSSFSEGDWEMYVLINEGTEEELKDLKPMYTDDDSLIKNIISNLILSKDTSESGFSHYTQSVYLVKNGKTEQYLWLYNTMGKVNINDNYFNYDAVLFKEQTIGFKEIPYTSFTIKHKQSAVKLRKYLHHQKAVLDMGFSDSLWTEFQGKLVFEVKFELPPSDIKPENEKLSNFIDTQIGDGKYFIDIPDSLLSQENDSDFTNYDSILHARNETIKQQIKIKSNLDSSQYKMDLYSFETSDDGKYDIEKYTLYTNRKNGRRFASYPIAEKWQPIENIPFNVYGIEFSEIRRLLFQLGMQ